MLKDFTALRLISPCDAALDQLQRQLQTLLKMLFGVEISKGQLIDVTFPAAANTDLKIQHSLGRVPVGFIPVYLSAAGTVYNSATTVGSPSQEIILKCSAAGLVSKLWIF